MLLWTAHSGQILNTWDFMPAQVICKFHKDLAKNERTMPWTTSTMAFFKNEGHITQFLFRWPGFQLVRDLMPVLVTRKFDKDPSIMKVLAWRHDFPSLSFMRNFSGAQESDPAGIRTQLGQNFVPVLDICKFDKGPTKNDWEKVETPFSPL